MVFGQLAMPVQCCAEAPAAVLRVSLDDVMSLGIKSSAFLRVLVLKTVQECGPSFLDMF